MKTKEELLKQREQIDAELKQIQESEDINKRKENLDRIMYIQDHFEIFMKAMEHDRASCNDFNPCNGIGSASFGGWRCDKCALIDIIEERNDDYEVNIGVTIHKRL